MARLVLGNVPVEHTVYIVEPACVYNPLAVLKIGTKVETLTSECSMCDDEQIIFLFCISPVYSWQSLPDEILEKIFLDVLLECGDVAYLTLSLFNKKFHNIMTDQHFRKQHHLLWIKR